MDRSGCPGRLLPSCDVLRTYSMWCVSPRYLRLHNNVVLLHVLLLAACIDLHLHLTIRRVRALYYAAAACVLLFRSGPSIIAGGRDTSFPFVFDTHAACTPLAAALRLCASMYFCCATNPLDDAAAAAAAVLHASALARARALSSACMHVLRRPSTDEDYRGIERASGRAPAARPLLHN
jgi:hypothetical protein